MRRGQRPAVPRSRDRPTGTGQSLVWLTDREGFGELETRGYVSLSHCPEIVAGVDSIARLVASMTIHLMRNTPDGDIRVRNDLSRVVDIAPNQYMTRSNFVYWLVKNLFLDGSGNVVAYPVTRSGKLKELIPIPPAYCAYIPDGEWGYRVEIAGRSFDPSGVCHFVYNPSTFFPWRGEGLQISLGAVADRLKQAETTEKGFLSSKWKPSIIVRVDALTQGFSDKTTRRKLLSEYIETSEAGEPWVLPADSIDVQQVKPLTLSDLALADFVKLDREMVASIIGVPPFVLGVGGFVREQWNTFISTKIMPLAENIQQELTQKLVTDPDMFFRFNSRSLYNYDLKELAAVADDQYIRGIMSGNEVRDWIGLEPVPGLNDRVILENYIPQGMVGQQKKLVVNGGDGNGE